MVSLMVWSSTLNQLPKRTLLELFDESGKTATVPASWKKATIILSHEEGKGKKDPNSYHPISLPSCPGTLLERVINRRLIPILEDQKTLSPTQNEYLKHRTSAGPHYSGARKMPFKPPLASFHKMYACAIFKWYAFKPTQDKMNWDKMSDTIVARVHGVSNPWS